VEKEGFLPLLQAAGIAERYDLAIMSSKGMGTTSVRNLIGQLFDTVKILVLHDFDKSGFSIAGTLTRDTKRYAHVADVKVIDLGLRLTDVEQWELQAEDVVHSADPAENLKLNGAEPEEIAFLRGEPVYSYGGGRFRGQRVELNALTSEAFVRWLESKLNEQQIRKVIPDKVTLERAYRRAVSMRRYRAVMRRAADEVTAYGATLEIPGDLDVQIQNELARQPSQSWDRVIESLLLPES
jgi:hypothetical protein